MRNERCETCRFWDESAGSGPIQVVQDEDDPEPMRFGACRRFPNSWAQTARLTTESVDWCGEWQATPPTLDEKFKRVLKYGKTTKAG